jgi:hypothetical protein
VDGDQVVLGVKAVHLDQLTAAGRPVDHDQREVVVGVDPWAAARNARRPRPPAGGNRRCPAAAGPPWACPSWPGPARKRAEVSGKCCTVPVLTSCSVPSTVIRKLSMAAIVSARPATSSLISGGRPCRPHKINRHVRSCRSASEAQAGGQFPDQFRRAPGAGCFAAGPAPPALRWPHHRSPPVST